MKMYERKMGEKEEGGVCRRKVRLARKKSGSGQDGGKGWTG